MNRIEDIPETTTATLREFDRLPPHDLDAERAVIASLMLAGDNRTLFDSTRRPLRTESFYQTDHGAYFDAIFRIAKNDRAIDAITVKDELIRSGLYAEVGGLEYHAKIIDTIPSAAHGPHYAAIVREKYILREIIRAGNDAIRRAYQPSREENGMEIAQRFLRDLTALACTGTADRIHRLGDVLLDITDQYSREIMSYIPTGLSEIDQICGGLPKGKFTLVGARPAMGKSQFCKQIVLNVARRGIPCGIVTIEEDRIKVGQNYLSNASGVENNHIAYGTVSEIEWGEIIGAMPELEKLPIFIADEPVKLGDVETAIVSLVGDHKCQVIVVDYLQLIDPDGEAETENREITRISKTLKAAFKRLGIAGIAACQLNRGNESGGVRQPTLRDLRGSGSLEQDGDLIFLLHRDDYYEKDANRHNKQLQAIVAKNKSGPVGTIPLWFSGKTQTIKDWFTADPFPPDRHVPPPVSGPDLDGI